MDGTLDAEQRARLDAGLTALLQRYPADHRGAAMLPALRLLQEIQGGISSEAMVLVAERLGVSTARAREAATFYSMFHTAPAGRHTVDVCTNISCCLRGGENVLSYLEKKLGVRAGQTTADKRITLREVECLASCGTAPVMQVDEVYVEELTPGKIDRALEALG